MRADANCSQTPDGRGQAGDHLKEIKSRHWSYLEKEEGLASDPQGESMGLLQSQCTLTQEQKRSFYSAHG